MKKAMLAAIGCAMAATAVFAQQATQPTVQPTVQPATTPAAMPASPRGTAAAQVSGKWVEAKPGDEPRYRDGKWIVIDYGRPILRGRTGIFGTGADYGKKVNAGAPVWRAGANQTTRIRTEAPLALGGQTLPAGEYSVFVDLKQGAWTLILSTQPFQQKYDPNNKIETWGSDNYDAKFDVLRVPMKTTLGTLSVEQFTIGFINMTQQGGSIAMWWDATTAVVDFKVGQ